MDEKELALLLGKVAEQTQTSVASLKTEINATLSGVMKTEDLAQKLEGLGLKDGVIENLTKAIETQGLEMRKLLNPGDDMPVKSVKELLIENKSVMNRIANGEHTTFRLDIPVKTIATTASVGSNTTALRLTEIGQLATLGSKMSGLFPHVMVPPEMNNHIRYIDQLAITRNAAGRAENGVFGESAITWLERSFDLREIADSIPVTKESFKFISFIEGEINKLLTINIGLIEDSYLWDGADATPISEGIYTYAALFGHAAYAANATTFKPEHPSIADLAVILAEQISNGFESKYQANLMIANPGDLIGLKLAKNTLGNYIVPPFLSADGRSIDGMEVVSSSQVDKGTMLVGDRRFATIYDGEALTIEAGWITDQFTHGAMTLRAYKRSGLLVRTGDVAAFMKVADISAVLAAIESTKA